MCNSKGFQNQIYLLTKDKLGFCFCFSFSFSFFFFLCFLPCSVSLFLLQSLKYTAMETSSLSPPFLLPSDLHSKSVQLVTGLLNPIPLFYNYGHSTNANTHQHLATTFTIALTSLHAPICSLLPTATT